MATLEQLRTWIESTVDDDSFEADYIDALINEAIEEIAAQVLLPDLESSDVVTTVVDSAVADLPADYSRGLYGVSIAEQTRQPVVLSSMKLMQERYPDIEAENVTGDIKYVCTRGTELVYQPVPVEATDVTIRYYMNPTPLASDGDSPSYIPARMHRPLIVSYVYAILFDDIEDGMEGVKANTQRHEQRYEVALAKLAGSIKTGQSRPGPPQGVNQWV